MTDFEELFNAHTHFLPENSQGILQANLQNLPVDTFFSLGIHPYDSDQFEDEILQKIVTISDPNFIAIGEIGLDSRIEIPLEQQELAYISQLKLAQQLRKPVILHCVNQWDRCRHLHQQFAPDTWLIYHGFNKASILEQVVHYPKACISIGSSVLSNTLLREKLALIPQNRLLVETDDTDCQILDIYHCIAANLSLPLHPLIRQVRTNATAIFKV